MNPTHTPSAPDSQKLREAIAKAVYDIGQSDLSLKWEGNGYTGVGSDYPCLDEPKAIERIMSALTPFLLTASAGQEAAKLINAGDALAAAIKGLMPFPPVLNAAAVGLLHEWEKAKPSPLPVVETPSANTQEGEDKKIVDWLEKRDRACVTIHFQPKIGLMPYDEWDIHKNGTGFIAERCPTFRSACLAAMEASK